MRLVKWDNVSLTLTMQKRKPSTRRRHMMAFKEEAARLVMKEDYKITEVARSLKRSAALIHSKSCLSSGKRLSVG